MSAKTIDVVVLIFLVLLGSLYTFLTRDLFIGKGLISAVVLAIPGVIYLGLRGKKHWKKIIISTLIFGALFGFIFEFIQEFNNSYHVVSSVFPKILGVVPLDNILGHIIMAFGTLVFYEHFVDRRKSSGISRHIYFVLLPTLFIIPLVLIVFFVNPELLKIPYPYLYAGVAAIIPTIILGFSRPAFVKDMAVTAIFFFFLYFIYEIFAVKYSWWIYPGNNYIGQVSIIGITYPFEELFFWMMFYAASLVSYYELFVDEA